ncbi:MAG: hypothetical protein HC867_05140 [Bacteroidia bacterium]|nr:hypothetical protein [Bacteroidia bacterium]
MTKSGMAAPLKKEGLVFYKEEGNNRQNNCNYSYYKKQQAFLFLRYKIFVDEV